MFTCKENLYMSAALSGRAPGLVDRLVATMLDWRDRARSRRLLATLDDRTLHDFGLTRAGAAYEAGKPFWKQ